MPRIAVIADIHGNMPALEAVIEDIERQGADEVLVGGDLVGRGPEGRRVVDRIRGLGWPTLRGNHEDYLLAFRRGEVPDDWLETDEWAASRWMAGQLSQECVAFLEHLPFSLGSLLTGELRLVHGTPRSHGEGIGPWSSDAELAEHLSAVDEPLLVCAHTHRPLRRDLAEGLVVNVGSVGLPFNRDRRAQYGILERAERGWQVEFRRVEYDLGRTFEAYRSSGFLREGGITARLLMMELAEAAPLLVPFLQWARARGIEPQPSALEEFLDFYDPAEPMGSFWCRLQALARRTANGG